MLRALPVPPPLIVSTATTFATDHREDEMDLIAIITDMPTSFYVTVSAALVMTLFGS